MLLRLSGRLHQVWSATAVRWNGVWHRWCESAVVSIPELTADQMDVAHVKFMGWKSGWIRPRRSNG